MSAASTSSIRQRAFVIAMLLAPPLLAMLVIRIARTDPQHRIGAHAPTTVVAAVPTSVTSAAPSTARAPERPFCLRLVPTSFGVVAGGTQQISAAFVWSGRGSEHFKWSSSGGTLSELEETSTHASLDGFVMNDSFDGAVLDPQLWKAVVPEGASISQADGVLTLHDPGGSARDGGVRLQTAFELRGDFAVEMTLVRLDVHGISGAIALSFRTQDGLEPLLRRVSRSAMPSIEAVTPGGNGSAHTTANVFDPGGTAKLRIVRIGANLNYQVEVGGSQIPVGPRQNAGSTASGTVAISASSADERPEVTAIVDNFALAQNLDVVWHAPSDAPLDALYTIQTGDSCSATARIIRR